MKSAIFLKTFRTRHLFLSQLLLILFVMFESLTAQTNTIRVKSEPGILNSSIENAIQRADSGDTVLLEPGVYAIHDLQISKSITLQGQEGSILDIEERGYGLILKGTNITLKNFEIRNSGSGFMEDFAAILIENSRDIHVEDLTLTNNFFGIFIAKSERILVSNNNIFSNAKRQTTSGNGIHLWYSKNVEAHNNTITGHRDGIYLEFVEESKMSGNNVFSNIRYGLHFMYSNSCSYIGNTFEDNTSGVAVMYTKNVEMLHNHFINNWGANRYGLLLKEINDSVVKYNLFESNSVGIYSEASNRVLIEQNEFRNNGTALRMMANGLDNRIEQNNFISNVFEVTTNSRQNPNHYEGNYWSQYEGYDLNGDGIGDVEYRPVRLFSLLAEKEPLSLIMLRSIMAGVLDTAERVFPVLTPKNLVDPKPLMQPNQ
ncbi:nitrous oxide reductase family maturation protein NosD [Rhodohalobacter sulfatireducens]|uniref:Nitrous oxide reductase family maturation protein NosD n=1 Tax=Rhodohalobacter sulfatireducens TaxID=2911366 RepID=A0ABS9KCI0_9BACT|nr:nitrous oxide reductase family maturation protein NosD [Rhodohalobacter sulfatireducens]MCG2588554.1 nitrous oxide reductase family maturation protein NosD [Rhodohalobacter sulfatireducens]MDR9363904.1 nitrous oxide reductase family maturation protein NosD [Balneolaceae bacterium]MDR9407201.1 nitrous oxide reductase family maturation protein NosD [Balneolaceae bacterium]